METAPMKTSDFNFDLPGELIAQTPIEPRDASRLMTLDRRTGETAHRRFYEIAELIRPEDCLILNDSRVLPASLPHQRISGPQTLIQAPGWYLRTVS